MADKKRHMHKFIMQINGVDMPYNVEIGNVESAKKAMQAMATAIWSHVTACRKIGKNFSLGLKVECLVKCETVAKVPVEDHTQQEIWHISEEDHLIAAAFVMVLTRRAVRQMVTNEPGMVFKIFAGMPNLAANTVSEN